MMLCRTEYCMQCAAALWEAGGRCVNCLVSGLCCQQHVPACQHSCCWGVLLPLVPTCALTPCVGVGAAGADAHLAGADEGSASETSSEVDEEDGMMTKEMTAEAAFKWVPISPLSPLAFFVRPCCWPRPVHIAHCTLLLVYLAAWLRYRRHTHYS